MSASRRISCTQEDIDEAIQNNSSKCVVALAIAREMPNATRIRVDMHGIRVTLRGLRYHYLIPVSVEAYIVGFDAGAPIKPFQFWLRNDQRILVRRKKLTPEGKAKASAAATARRADQRLARVKAKPVVSETEVQAATEKAEASRQRVAEVEQQVSGLPQTTLEHHDVPAHKQRVSPKRGNVFQGDRVYGGRVMRINSDRGPGVAFRGPLDTEDPIDVPTTFYEDGTSATWSTTGAPVEQVEPPVEEEK